MRQLLFLFIVFAIIGCNNGENNSQGSNSKVLDDLNLKYKDAKDFFGAEYTEHFPDKINENNITFTESYSPDVGNLELMVIDSIVSNEAYSDIMKIGLQALSSYKSTDSCLLVVNRFVNNENFYKVQPPDEELKEIDNKCYNDKLPIPNFWHNKYTTDNTSCKLPSDFFIFVLESKAGKFKSDEYLTNGKQMPDNWKNGFSRGIAVSKKRSVVIYWLIIW